jgi:hypothetical protein
MTQAGRGLVVALAVAAVAALAACARPSGPPALHLLSKSYDFYITPSDAPPHAREDILYKVTVLDHKTQEPIENGEGQIFANTRDGARTWDGFANGKEVGAYYGKLNFVTADLWAMAIRFRRDSLHPLERVDWMQDVLNERPDSIP